jgi:hypothetical protein
MQRSLFEQSAHMPDSTRSSGKIQDNIRAICGYPICVHLRPRQLAALTSFRICGAAVRST